MPVIVAEYGPTAALHELKVRVAVAVPEAPTETVIGLVVPPQPVKLAARGDETERVTGPVNPLRPVTVIVDGQHEYWSIVIEFGFAESL